MRKHALFVAGLLGILLVNGIVIRYCWANRDTARPSVRHHKPIKPGTATATRPAPPASLRTNTDLRQEE